MEKGEIASKFPPTLVSGEYMQKNDLVSRLLLLFHAAVEARQVRV